LAFRELGAQEARIGPRLPGERPESVLIADDDPQIRALLVEYASELGLPARQAANGVSALAQARHSPLLTRVRLSGEESSLAPQPLAPIVTAARARVSSAAGRRSVKAPATGP
jgi:CheY-like chemotaxis protein